MRYETNTVSVLPEGDFAAIAEPEFSFETALKLTMEKPDSIYLRGYIGEVFTDLGWEPIDKKVMNGYTSLFYQLHKNNFYPQTQLAELARTEAVEVAAVMFSRLPVARATQVFGLLDAGLARRIAYAMSLTAGIEAPALRRIGLALMRAVESLPKPAIDAQPVEKLGALLNLAPAQTRDTVLAGLDQDDAAFAVQVRRTIFTWANIPRRLDPRDIPRVMREVDAATIAKAMAGAIGDDAPTVEFLLGGLGSRLADSMREEIEAVGKVSARDAEAAMTTVVAAIREMEQAGELVLLTEAEEEEDATTPPGAAPEG